MNILLDPYLLVVPQEAAVTQTYMENLYLWTAAITRNEHHFWLSQCLLNALWDEGCYPTWDALQKLEQRMPTDKAFNINTFFRACETQLTTPPLLEDEVRNDTLYYEDEEVVVIPPEIEARLPASVSRALKKTLALSVLGGQLRSSDVFSSLLFGTAPDGFKATQLDVHLLAQNLETDALAELRSTLGMIFAPNEADGYEVLESIWQNTQKAVSWAYQTLKRDGTLSGHARELPRITAKPCFNESILELHLEQQDNAMKSLFGAVIEAALGVRPRYMKAEGNTHHPLREGIQQIDRKVDEATAWRLHFHADYRLHYWLLPNGDMELSLVVVHENAKIV